MSGGTVPARLGKYEIRGTLGRGAMGTVYDGWDPAIERRVAIKTVRLAPGDDEEGTEGLARFKREAQAAGRLSHPNIVGVYDYGEIDDVALIVMEFVEGRSLKEMLGPEQRMSTTTALRLMADVLAGLGYSHGRGVIHRDIKPANIMVTTEGLAKIADFGIARIEASSMTQAGTVMGTPAYMSPEQLMGQVVDARTDIYSCGVMLYQLLTGERPFEGSMSSIMHKALTTMPPRPSDLSVTAPRALDAVVARAMARQPDDRFPTADAFAEALRDPSSLPEAADALDATIVAPRPARTAPPAPATAPPPASARSGGTRSRAPLVAGLGIALLGAVGIGTWMLLPGSHPPAPDPAPPLRLAPQAALPAPQPAPAIPVTPPEPEQAPAQAAVPPARPVPSLAPSSPPSEQAGPSTLTPVPPVAPPALAPPERPSQGAVLLALATKLPGVGCSLVQSSVATDGVATLSGLVGAGAPEAALRDAVAAAAPAGRDWQVRAVDGPFCPVINLLAATAPAISENGLRLVQEGGPAPLLDNEPVVLRASLPGFAGFLHVAYLQHDGTVAVLVPGPGYPSQTYPARASVLLGPGKGSFPGWRVGPPFGTDMILAVASTAPLFTRPPPASQPVGPYLAELQAAMDALRRRGGLASPAAVVLDTRPGR